MLETEKNNLKTVALDKQSTDNMLRLFQIANEESVQAVEKAFPNIVKAVDAATKSIAAGGRIIYAGAGTSGRLATLDASECPTTFGIDYSTVVALIAGGRGAVFKSAPEYEDSREIGRKDILDLSPNPKDFVIGISASGGAAYVVGVLEAARECGSKTASLSSNSDTPIAENADIEIVTPTGPEPITGSTRMKAGNAQKMVLNMISTGAMVKTGKVRGNLMINLKPSNEKLRNRMVSIVVELANVLPEKAIELLNKHEWSIPKVLEEIEK